jgi:hypothetical protein
MKRCVLDLRRQFFCDIFVGNNDVKSSNSFSVHTHIFGEGLADEHVEALLEEISHGPDVLFKTAACETLVGRVEERDQAVGFHHFADLFPLLLRRVDAGGVVGAHMEEDG